MRYQESNNIELKEQITDTFLKTVCAFANEDGGKIIFGVNDSGKIVGIKNINEEYPKIERKIFDSISPIPYFSLEIDHAINTIAVNVEPGDEKPYFLKHKTYIRRNTSTILADAASQKRMIMEAKGIGFEEIPLKYEFFNFEYLKNIVQKSIGVNDVDKDFLKTCGLIGKDGNFNNAARLFSDENDLSAIDVVKYDEVNEKFSLRKSFSKCCILKQVESTLDIFEDVYSYEKIVGIKRLKFYDIPVKAFREALINAVIHRDFEIKSQIKVTFFDDRIEIMSPGVLPKDISKKEFLNSFVSVPRNYIICSMFRRLGYIERMGYGISLIKRAYRDSAVKPRFEFLDNFINVILPLIRDDINFNNDEKAILNTLKYSKALSSSEIAALTKISKTKVVGICNMLCNRNIINKIGTGRGTKYSTLNS